MFLGIYTSAFKGNQYLYRAVLTGLIRIPTNEPTTIHLETFIDLKHLNSSITNFDNLLLYAGYLTIDPVENSNKEYRTVFKVKAPNLEIHTIFSEIINS